MCVTDRNFEAGGPRIVAVNKAFEQLTGYCKDEVIGRSPHFLQGPETDRSIFANLKQTLEADGIWSGQTINYRKDGAPFCMRWSIHPSHDDVGNPTYCAYQREVSDADDRDEYLEDHLATLSSALSLSEIGFYRANYDTREILWSPKAYEICGVPEGIPLTQEYVRRLIHPDDLTLFKEEIASATTERKFRIIRPVDGEVRWLATRRTKKEARPDGSAKFTFGVIWDITKTVAEQESEIAVWSEAVNAAGEGMAIFDRDGRAEYANASFMASPFMCGTSQADIEGRTLDKMICKADRDSVESALARLENRDPTPCTVIVSGDADKEPSFYEFAFSVIGADRILCVSRDVTERQRYQRETEKLKDQLYQAQKMEAMGRFAGGIAHDFNNILSTMLGYNGMLIEDLAPGSDQFEYAEMVAVAGKRASNLVRQILDYSRTHEFTFENVYIAEALSEIEGMLRVSIPPNIDLSISNATRNAVLKADNTRLSQVLMNLCINARDAIGNDKGTIRLAATQASLPDRLAGDPDKPSTPVIETDGENETRLWIAAPFHETSHGHDRWIRISVTDSGSGIKPDVIGKVFDPFFTTKAIGTGTGLGLPAVHGIVADHGGAISLRSAVGQGTTIALYLPVDHVTAQKQGDPVLGSEVIVVSCVHNTKKISAQQLARHGIVASVFGSVQEAVDGLESHHHRARRLFYVPCAQATHITGSISALREVAPSLELIVLKPCISADDTLNDVLQHLSVERYAPAT